MGNQKFLLNLTDKVDGITKDGITPEGLDNLEEYFKDQLLFFLDKEYTNTKKITGADYVLNVIASLNRSVKALQ